MKKKFSRLMAVICMILTAVCLSGCMYVGLGVEMRNDGTGCATVTYGMSSDVCTEEDLADSGYEIKRFTIDGKEYVGYDFSEEYKNYNDMGKALTDLSEDGQSLFKTAKAEKKNGLFVSKYTFEAVMPVLIDNAENDYMGMTDDMIKIDFTLKMPGTVKYCQGGEIGADGSITFSVDPSSECSYSVESEEVNFVAVFIAIAAVIILIGIIAAGIKKEKKA